MELKKPKKISKVLSAEDDMQLRQFVKLQGEYKKALLSRMYKAEELKEIRRQLNGKITVQWRGIPCPEEMLKIEHDMVQEEYKAWDGQVTRVTNGLKEFGFRNKQFKALLEKGEYVKELPKRSKKPGYVG